MVVDLTIVFVLGTFGVPVVPALPPSVISVFVNDGAFTMCLSASKSAWIHKHALSSARGENAYGRFKILMFESGPCGGAMVNWRYAEAGNNAGRGFPMDTKRLFVLKS
jgi:hypothetical protein